MTTARKHSYADVTMVAATVAVRRYRKDGYTAEDFQLAHKVLNDHETVRAAIAAYRHSQENLTRALNHAVSYELDKTSRD